VGGQRALFELRRQLRYLLPRLADLVQQIARTGFGILLARQCLTCDRLVTRGLRPQLAIGQGLALEVLAYRIQLRAQRVDLRRPRGYLLCGGSMFEFRGGRGECTLPQLLREVGNRWRYSPPDRRQSSRTRSGVSTCRFAPVFQRRRQIVGRATAQGGTQARHGRGDALLAQPLCGVCHPRPQGCRASLKRAYRRAGCGSDDLFHANNNITNTIIIYNY
jgi:hypothetical protein